MAEKLTSEQLIKELNKEFGDGSAIRLTDDNRVKVDVIPTGSISLDFALGVGGLPRGRIVEIFGPESGGKTTLALNVIAQAQKLGGKAAYIDAEHALDPDYSEKLGVNLSELIISQPNGGEEALNLMQRYVESGIIDIVVVDSVAALTPTTEMEGNMGSQFIGLQARMMSQAMRKITPLAAKHKTLIIFINQIRMKIGGPAWGNPETTPGGNALKYHASVRLDIRRISNVKEGENIIGTNVKVKVAKNKVAAPFKTAEFILEFGKGIAKELDILNTAVLYDVVRKEGNTYFYGEEKIGVGISASWQVLKENQDLLSKIRTELLKEDSEEETETKKSKRGRKKKEDVTTESKTE